MRVTRSARASRAGWRAGSAVAAAPLAGNGIDLAADLHRAMDRGQIDILFQRADGVEAGWQAVQPFLDAWKTAGNDGIETYDAGSDGPACADELLRRDGRSWRKY